MSRTSSSVPDHGPIDPAGRARLFPVQLRDDAASVRGRLTHVATGETAHFDSGDELVTLLTRVGRPIGGRAPRASRVTRPSRALGRSTAVVQMP